MSSIEVTTHGVATGGAAVGRDPDGRVTFIEGGLPGETLEVSITKQRKSHAFATIDSVLVPAHGRVEPACPNVERGCGGCGLSHAAPDLQLDMKHQVVTDSLRRIGKIPDPIVRHGSPLVRTDFRTTVRAGVADGRAGLRRSQSHELVAFESCPVAHPLVEELLVDGRFGGVDEVTVRVGAGTGERMVHLTGGSVSIEEISVPSDVVVVIDGRPAAGGPVWIHEEVAGHRYQLSARSFFQTRPDGAEQLIEVVAGYLPPDVGVLVDLCAGVGLFSVAVEAKSVIGVESNVDAMADFDVNTSSEPGRARSVTSSFQQWAPEAADVVVADPSRSGLGADGVAVVAATGAADVVLVSCDAGSMGRDAGLLVNAGYDIRETTLVDLFPDTPHIEAVTAFRRTAR